MYTSGTSRFGDLPLPDVQHEFLLPDLGYIWDDPTQQLPGEQGVPTFSVSVVEAAYRNWVIIAAIIALLYFSSKGRK